MFKYGEKWKDDSYKYVINGNGSKFGSLKKCAVKWTLLTNLGIFDEI